MSEVDFRKPQETRSINGFPIYFRPVHVDGLGNVWVPKGISRNPIANCWRLYLVSEQGLFTNNVYDTEYRRSPLDALYAAYQLMLEVLKDSTSRFVVDKRARPEGVERNPLVDCGATGVVISRNTRKGYKVVTVTTHMSVEHPSGGLQTTNYYAGGISERSDITNPVKLQEKFEQLVRNAVAVRRFYNHLRSKGLYPSKAIKLEDVPESIQRRPFEIPEHLNIVEIMDSYMAVPWTPVPRTTGGDPGKLAAALQAHDLSHPHKLVYLNGFALRFIRRIEEGKLLYLPKELYRARGEWRLRIFHEEGVYSDSVTDAECGFDSGQSLKEAWQYLVSQLRHLKAPPPENRRPAKHPLLETGIRAVNLAGFARLSRKSGEPRWSFFIGIQHTKENGKTQKATIARWHLSSVTDEQIHEGLRHAAALSAYRDYLLEHGVPVPQANVSRDTEVPQEFWPDAPPCPISADDLRYFAEQIDR